MGLSGLIASAVPGLCPRGNTQQVYRTKPVRAVAYREDMKDTTTAVIIGAGPRLGAAIARALAGTGRSVGLIGRSVEKTAQLAATLRDEGMTTSAAAANVADAADLTSAIEQIADQIGPIDVAVHNVSVWSDHGAVELSAEELLDAIAVGTASLATITRAVAPGMIERGRGTILATGSGAADHPTPGAPALAVQKAGLRILVRGYAAELAEHGVHCATVTINGGLGQPGFAVADIAPAYAELVSETDGPREQWRTVVEFNGA